MRQTADDQNAAPLKEGFVYSEKETAPDPLNFPYINWDPHSALRHERGTQSPALGLAHEMEHARTYLEGDIEYVRYSDAYIRNSRWKFLSTHEEYVVLGPETMIARELGENPRPDHTSLGQYNVKCPTSRKETQTLMDAFIAGFLRAKLL